MAKKINDGGPAFPTVNENHAVGSEGISVRDYFAAAAMQGMLVGCAGTIGTSDQVSAYAHGHCNSAVVERAYAMADAMLRAREVGNV